MLHLEYGLRADSGGPGKWRGGLGVRRRFKLAAPEMTVSGLSGRHKRPPWGLLGGKPGAPQLFGIRRAGEKAFRTFKETFGTTSATKFVNITLVHGDEVVLESPGGGGYGSPLERDPEAVLRDVLDGFVSVSGAREQYGVVIRDEAGTLRIDHTATNDHRATLEQVAAG
jgi:N-methylhydantoinase B/oxoprolinase/acetone carboxylase alpha subunit